MGSDLRWLDSEVGSPVVGQWGRISGVWVTGSDLRWLDSGVGSPVVGQRGRISGGWP